MTTEKRYQKSEPIFELGKIPFISLSAIVKRELRDDDWYYLCTVFPPQKRSQWVSENRLIETIEYIKKNIEPGQLVAITEIYKEP